MTITETQKTAQLAADAAVSAAEAKQYMLEAEQGYQDTSAAAQQAQDAASAAELARDQAESIASGLEEKIDAQLTEQQEEFETQMTSQQESFESAQTERDTDFSEFLDTRNSAFISQFNQQAQEFDAQLASQESRYESVLQQAGKTVLGRYQDGPWTLTSYNQLVSYGGTFWKLAASVDIGAGYTTAGTTGATWDATDRANFVDVGQDQLRTELGTIFMPAASGDSATDTQLLQAALSVGGQIIYNNPGKYYYSSTSTIRSNTRLVIGHGVTWEKDINSVWGPFLWNAAYSNSRYAVTSMTVSTSYSDPWKDNVSSSGLKAYLNIACPGHNFIAGDYVAFYGAVEFGFDGIMKVVSVTDGDNFVVEAHNLPKGTSATYDAWANGLFCFKADENISVEIYGRLDGKCTQLKASGEPSDTMKLYLMGMIFHGIMNGSLYINSIRRMRKYSALIANVRNFVVPFANIDNYSDGLHFMPPYVGVHIKTIAGAGGDDIFALTGGDFAHYEISRGHGYDITCDKLNPQNALCAVKITGNAPYRFWNINIGGITGLTQTDAIKAIWDTNLTYTAIGKLKIGLFDCAVQIGSGLKLAADEIDSVVIDEYVISQKSTNGWDIAVGDSSRNKVAIKSLIVRNVRLKTPDVAVTRFLQLGRAAEVDSVDIHSGCLDISALGSGFIYSNGATDTLAANKTSRIKLSGKISAPSANYVVMFLNGMNDVIDVSELDFEGFANLIRTSKTVAPWKKDHIDINARGLRAYDINRLFTLYAGQWKIGFSGEVLTPGALKLTPIFLGYNTTLHIDGYARVEGSSELMVTPGGSFTLVNSLVIPTAESPVAGDVAPVIHSYDKRNLLPLAFATAPQAGEELTNAVSGQKENRLKYGHFGWVPESDWRNYQAANDATAAVYRPLFDRGNVWHVNGIKQDITIAQSSSDWSVLKPGARVAVMVTQDSAGGHTVTFDPANFTFGYTPATEAPAGTTSVYEFVYQGGGKFYSMIPNVWA
ncbi:TPA: hypothetical protein MI658_05885 [Klebsiella pneumoniae]|nr:hypothetical protein [Klebsiella pneumoniae]